MDKNKYFGFLIHPRELEDFYVKFPYFRFLPKTITEFASRHLKPVIISKIKGLKNKNGQSVEGYVIAITLSAKQMLEDRRLALSKIKEAVILAKKLGVGVLGLGALTASLSRGGLDVAGLGVGINTGRAFTVRNIGNYLKWLEEKLNINKNESIVAVVGAAGSIGSSVAKLMKESGYKKFRLVDLEDKIQDVDQILIEDDAGGDDIKISHQLDIIRDADIIIAATSAPEVVIQPEDVKSGAIIINDAQPSDISPRILSERPDVLVLEGGAVRIENLDMHFNYRLKTKSDTFSCMAESMILAANGRFDDFGLGKLDMKLVSEIDIMSEQLPGISLSPQNSMVEVTDEYIQNFRKSGK